MQHRHCHREQDTLFRGKVCIFEVGTHPTDLRHSNSRNIVTTPAPWKAEDEHDVQEIAGICEFQSLSLTALEATEYNVRVPLHGCLVWPTNPSVFGMFQRLLRLDITNAV